MAVQAPNRPLWTTPATAGLLSNRYGSANPELFTVHCSSPSGNPIGSIALRAIRQADSAVLWDPGWVGSSSMLYPPVSNGVPGPQLTDFGLVGVGQGMTVLGGMQSDTSRNADAYSTVAANLSLGNWQHSPSSLPLQLSQSASTVALINGVPYAFMVGGTDASGTAYPNVYYAPLNADGSLAAAWRQGPSLPAAVAYASVCVATSGGYQFLVVTGGLSAGATAAGGIGGTASAIVRWAYLNPGGSIGDGSASSWHTATSMANARYGHTSVYTNGNLYVFGGYTGAAFAVAEAASFAAVVAAASAPNTLPGTLVPAATTSTAGGFGMRPGARPGGGTSFPTFVPPAVVAAPQQQVPPATTPALGAFTWTAPANGAMSTPVAFHGIAFLPVPGATTTAIYVVVIGGITSSGGAVTTVVQYTRLTGAFGTPAIAAWQTMTALPTAGARGDAELAYGVAGSTATLYWISGTTPDVYSSVITAAAVATSAASMANAGGWVGSSGSALSQAQLNGANLLPVAEAGPISSGWTASNATASYTGGILGLSSTAAALMSATTPTGTGGVPCVAGQMYGFQAQMHWPGLRNVGVKNAAGAPAAAGISLKSAVTYVIGDGTATNPYPIAGSTIGDTSVVAISLASAPVGGVSVTDSAGNVYTPVLSGVGDAKAQLWLFTAPVKAGATTFTVTFAGTIAYSVFGYELTNVSWTAPVQQTSSVVTGNTGAVTAVSLNNLNASDMLLYLLGQFVAANSTPTITPPASYTNPYATSGYHAAATNSEEILLDYLNPGASGTHTASATTSDTTAGDNWSAVLVALNSQFTVATFLVGDWITDSAGTIWVCTVAGNPGTWISLTGTGCENVHTAIGWYTSGGALISTSVGASVAELLNTWAIASIADTAPGTAAFMTPIVVVESTGVVGETHYVQLADAYLNLGGSLVNNADGSQDVTFPFGMVGNDPLLAYPAAGDTVLVYAQVTDSTTGAVSLVSQPAVVRFGHPPTIGLVTTSGPAGNPTYGFGFLQGNGGQPEKQWRITVVHAGTTSLDSGAQMGTSNAWTGVANPPLATATAYTVTATTQSLDQPYPGSSVSATATLTYTPTLSAPATPTSFTAVVDKANGWVAISAAIAANVATMRVYFRPTGGSAWALLKNVTNGAYPSSGTVTANLMDEIACATGYDFTVTAVGNDGSESGYATTVTNVSVVPPSANAGGSWSLYLHLAGIGAVAPANRIAINPVPSGTWHRVPDTNIQPAFAVAQPIGRYGVGSPVTYDSGDIELPPGARAALVAFIALAQSTGAMIYARDLLGHIHGCVAGELTSTLLLADDGAIGNPRHEHGTLKLTAINYAFAP